jgi:chromosomal replication initiation ATPase DnaA
MKQLKEVAQKINRLAELDIFNNTRKRQYIEARSLFCLIAYRYCNVNYSRIAEFLISNGKSSDHSTILHSIKNYEIYKIYNKNLDIWLEDVIENLQNLESNQKVQLVTHKLKQLTDPGLDLINEFVSKIHGAEEYHK